MRQRLMRRRLRGEHFEILILAEPGPQPLRLVDPDARESRPDRLDQFHLVAMLDHAAAQFVQILAFGLVPAVAESTCGPADRWW